MAAVARRLLSRCTRGTTARLRRGGRSMTAATRGRRSGVRCSGRTPCRSCGRLFQWCQVAALSTTRSPLVYRKSCIDCDFTFLGTPKERNTSRVINTVYSRTNICSHDRRSLQQMSTVICAWSRCRAHQRPELTLLGNFRGGL